MLTKSKEEDDRIGKMLLLIIFPLIILLCAIKLRLASGPFWLGINNDPSYVYLINFLNVLNNVSPSHTDHPGTTLQLLGAIVIKFIHFKASFQDILTAVINDSEFYLIRIYYVLLISYIASLIAVGLYAFSRTENILFSLLIQCVALLYLDTPSYNTHFYIMPIIANVFPEMLLITILNLYIILILKLYFDKQETGEKFTSLLLGVVCSFGIVTKITFAPLIILPIILLPGLKCKLRFIVVFFYSHHFS